MYNYAKFQMAPHYRGNHVLIPMGCDFTYANAHMNFKSMDRLIDISTATSRMQLCFTRPLETTWTL